MKRLICIFIFITVTGAFAVYGQTKDEDIRTLLIITGTNKLADQTMELMMEQFQQIFPDIPDIFWTKLVEKLKFEELLFDFIPLYDKYYTHDEIKQLIAFYETPLGRKLVEVSSTLAVDTMAIGQAWGENLGQEIVDELRNEGYLSY